jgi:hypothetical protein
VSERDDDRFSPAERRALDLWRAPAPPDDFSARVLTRLDSERAAPRQVRHFAVAALALVLVGGLLAVRLMSGESSSLGVARPVVGDGGSAAEASALADGVRS